MARSIGPALRHYWQSASKLPAGKWLFSRILGLVVPYTGSLGATVEHLEPGYCVVSLKDRRKVRNHLHSVHAIALANLGEMATGLALMNALPDNARGILVGLSVRYLKKARGRLTANCRCRVPANNHEAEPLLKGEIHDSEGQLVAEVEARWRIGPVQETSHAD
jgi:acyl-coenzyme A thioesterase PaaI-like protein